jgi:hypothetical protein
MVLDPVNGVAKVVVSFCSNSYSPLVKNTIEKYWWRMRNLDSCSF